MEGELCCKTLSLSDIMWQMFQSCVKSVGVDSLSTLYIVVFVG